MRGMGRLFVMLAAVWLALAPSQARAHPHVFVDVALRFETDDQGRLTGVEVTWRYDDFYSLLVLSDRGMDPDGDGRLTAREKAALEGFDLVEWPDGFDGGLFLRQEARDIALGPPEALGVTLEGNRIVSRHRRALGPVAPAGLVVKPYDPSYYAALTLVDVSGLPAGCAGTVQSPDRAEAAARAQDVMGEVTEDRFAEVEVGVYYADTLEVRCAPSS
jgi:ABC-type uncharacterized transport system substrate-binding protein